MSRFASILLWSVLAAAFIGPGTVATAAAAGSEFGYALLWALVFSTVACLVLQEASARLTIVSGRNLAQALRDRYPYGVSGTGILLLVLGAVVLGCAAYEAGNILGGVAGAALALPERYASQQALTAVTVGLAACLLWFNSPRRVAVMLSVLVAVMGVAFLWTAARLAPEIGVLLHGALVPQLPAGGALLAVALVGTTVVPYNLFLGSGLASGQRLAEMRVGLGVAIGLGGLISMGVLVVGTAVAPPLAYPQLAGVLTQRIGEWGGWLFALGLFAAGLSSAVTAPLAAALTARGLFSGEAEGTAGDRWGDRSLRYRAVWSGVLAVGLLFGLSGVKPIPVIVLAQAFNGLLLPLVAMLLLIIVNDRKLMGRAVNGIGANAVLLVVTLVAVYLGVLNLLRAGSRVWDGLPASPRAALIVSAVFAIVSAGPLVRSVVRGAREEDLAEQR